MKDFEKLYPDMPTSGNTNLYFEAHKPVFFNKNLYFLKTYTNRLPLPHFITRIFITSIVIHFMPLWKHHFCYVRETIRRCKWHVMFNNIQSPQCLRSDGIVIIGFRWHKLQDRLITVLSLRITAVFRSCNVLCYVVYPLAAMLNSAEHNVHLAWFSPFLDGFMKSQLREYSSLTVCFLLFLDAITLINCIKYPGKICF